MSESMLLFSIGPVQSFIEQARKTYDLFSGSSILSYLIDLAIRNLPKDAKLIFPYKELESKPNRFIAIINTQSNFNVAKRIEQIVRVGFKDMAIKAYKANIRNNNIPDAFIKQIDNMLEINWVILSCEKASYKSCYNEIERLMGSIKNIRYFNQVNEKGRKCSICGERNALFYNSKDGHKPLYIQDDAIYLENSYIDKGEGLCAVCFTKRFNKINPGLNENFYSLAHIALINVLNKIHDETGIRLITKYRGNFPSQYYDDELLYKENINKAYLDKNMPRINIDIEKVKNDLYELYKYFKDNNYKLNRYYAAIQFDGDSMGKWLSGIKLNTEIDLRDFHNDLTMRLGTFANYAKKYLKEKDYGNIVYAGGEDFLGFLNIEYLFETLNEYRATFDKIVSQPLKKYFKNKEDNITFSAGIVISHYKTPLNIVLRTLRNAEKEAKCIDDEKNAFELVLLKHSGEINKTRLKWNYDEINIMNVINYISEELRNKVFSNTFIRVLYNEINALNNGKQLKPIKCLTEIEIDRLVTRSYLINKSVNETDEEYREKKKNAIKNMVDNMLEINTACIDDIENYLSLLNILMFLSKEENYAN
ncbi:type III-B CRISPR-associated protein Cas10/Cmr2 [Thermoanaerobacterium thermosaccharolyticum]|uniref:type III-B CRISPR-associated protein Cas10/Cmr2 n=1 Tax=Thermoanaerobacterium thermosaccharolyticum TaxID=1517 RepID=UPI003DA9FB65